MNTLPTEPGFYWAKLVNPTRMPPNEDWVSADWEVVSVYDNNGEGDERLAVAVPGIEPSQWVKDFEWGPRIDMSSKPGAPRQQITTSEIGLPAKRTNLNRWIEEQFAGVRIAHRREEEPAWAGEPFCSIEVAQEIARGAALQVIADQATLIDNLANLCHGRNVTAGWWTDLHTGEDLHGKRNVGELLMLCVSELAEAMEGHRKKLMDDKLPHHPMITVELADTLIRIFDLAGSMKLELGRAFVEKLEFNASRADHKPENRRKENGKAY